MSVPRPAAGRAPRLAEAEPPGCPGDAPRRARRRHVVARALALALAAACATPAPVAPPAQLPLEPPPKEPPQPPAADARPEVVDVRQELEAAAAARAAGEVDVARSHLERAVQADPSLGPARLDLAEILIDYGYGLAEAERLLGEVRALGVVGSRLPLLEGRLAEARGDPAAAVDAYARSLEVAPTADLMLRRGLLLSQLGRRAEAVAQLEAARAARPDDRMARDLLAELYESEGRFADAERELLALERAAPASPAPWRRLADFYRRRGDARRARKAEVEARRLGAVPPRDLRPLRRSSR